MARLEATMAIDIDKAGLDEIRRKMLALKSAIEDYVDGIDMEEAEGRKAKKAKKDMEENDE